MQEQLKQNQAAWRRAKALTNALQMEKEYGCELSPYTKVLLDNLQKLVLGQIDLNARVKHVH